MLEWAREMLPEYFCDPPAPFHAELFADLRAGEGRLIARVAPRGHAKSTCAAFAYPLWCICERQQRNIVIMTHAAPLATQFVRDIRQELECNERILKRYGDLCSATERVSNNAAVRGKKHAVKRTTISARATQRARLSKPSPAALLPISMLTQQSKRAEATHESPAEPPRDAAARVSRRRWSAAQFTTNTGIAVQAKGTGASFRGVRVGPHRPDLIICDDLENDEQVRSAEGRQKLEHWFRKVMLPALHPKGRVVVLGSLIHYDSLLANLSDPDRFAGWDYRVYRAIECSAQLDGSYRRTPLWESRWPLERLDEERLRIGTVAFEQEYQANPIDDSQVVFRPEWLRRYRERELVGLDLTNLIAVDPATGKNDGDFFALWVGSVDRASGVIYTRVLSLKRIGFVQQVKLILAAAAEWQPVRIGIETTAYQAALKQVLEEESRKQGLYLPLVGMNTRVNKKQRIEGTCMCYENGSFLLPPQLDAEAETQFLQFPRGKHDDAPDVCTMGIELARSIRGGARFQAVLPERGAAKREW